MSDKNSVALELLGELNERTIEEAYGIWEEFEARIKPDRKIWKSNMVKAACAVLVVGSLCMINPKVRAAVSETVGKIVSILGLDEEILPYTEIIGQAQTKNGITLTLEEAVQTDNQMLYSFSWDCDDTVKLEEGMEMPSFALGGWSRIQPMGISLPIAKSRNRKNQRLRHWFFCLTSNMDMSFLFAYRHYSICQNGFQYAFL